MKLSKIKTLIRILPLLFEAIINDTQLIAKRVWWEFLTKIGRAVCNKTSFSVSYVNNEDDGTVYFVIDLGVNDKGTLLAPVFINERLKIGTEYAYPNWGKLVPGYRRLCIPVDYSNIDFADMESEAEKLHYLRLFYMNQIVDVIDSNSQDINHTEIGV